MKNQSSTPVERMYFAWNDALSRNDAAALLALYAPDAVFEGLIQRHCVYWGWFGVGVLQRNAYHR